MSDLVDLHLHSTRSDGCEEPARVVELAARAGMRALSLTDHDTISGLDEGRAAAERLGIEWLSGIEVTVEVEGVGVHLLVYGFDVPSAFSEEVAGFEEARRERVPALIARLAELGLELDEAEVRAQAGGELVGRLHFAEALRKRGYVRTTQQAFDRYLGEGRPAHVERRTLPAPEVIEAAHRSGGVVVLAHPGATPADDPTKERIVDRLIAAGLDGLEVWHPAHGRARERHYAARAERAGLLATGGSDFHGTPHSDVRVGRGRGRLRVPYAVLESIRERSATHRAGARSDVR